MYFGVFKKSREAMFQSPKSKTRIYRKHSNVLDSKLFFQYVEIIYAKS